jgi:hypothetical protein
MSNFISLTKAKAMVATYREMKETVLKSEYLNILPVAETFGRSQFDTILANEGCTGLRIYYGMSDDLHLHAIVVGVNANNEDMIPKESNTSTSDTITSSTTTTEGDGGNGEEDDPDEDDIIEDGAPCPPFCPPPSGLYP